MLGDTIILYFSLITRLKTLYVSILSVMNILSYWLTIR